MHDYYVTGSAKTSCVGHELKFILLPQLIVTLNNYACSLPPLVNVNWSAFQSAFYQPRKFTTGEMMPMLGTKSAVGM